MSDPSARIAVNVPLAKALYTRIRSRAQHTGLSVEQIVTISLDRYLSAPAQFQPLLTYRPMARLVVLSCTLDPALIARLHTAMPAHKPEGRTATLSELIAAALDADIKRQDQAARNARNTMGKDNRFKM